jgi:4-amino-4-deoxy-L-arabinose transferase-like glycosyltransferase
MAARNSLTNLRGRPDSSTRRQNLTAVAAAVGFIFLGALFIPLAGLQADEALFAAPLYTNINRDLAVHYVPLMVMSYLGTLKTLLYAPLLAVAGSNIWVVRFPMVLAGALTIFLFYRLAVPLTGPRPALAGCFLLATDPLFLLTSTYDWGPVAIEHVLLVTGCLALCSFVRSDSDSGGPNRHIAAWGGRGWLALGCFAFGLALWNKAIFSWALTGLGVAGLVTLWPYVRPRLTVRNVATALAAFLLGVAPLLIYNLRSHGATFRENAHLVPREIPGKFIQVESGLNGTSLFGYIPAEEWQGPAKAPSGVVFAISKALREALGVRRWSGFAYVAGLALLLVPLWWRSRAAWFALVFTAVAWLLMAATQDAGGSAHHVVLLWPFPTLFVVIAMARLPRWALIGATVVLVGLNLSVDNQYFYQFLRNGTARSFTDAIFPLSRELDPTKTIYVTDWGIYDSLNLLHRGALHVNVATDLTLDAPDAEQKKILLRQIHDSNGLFVGHVAAEEFFPHTAEHLTALAAAEGLRREVVRTVPDSNGRPMFEIARLVPSP